MRKGVERRIVQTERNHRLPWGRADRCLSRDPPVRQPTHTRSSCELIVGSPILRTVGERGIWVP